MQGLAYQLVDDALDFTANQATLGKPALADLREVLLSLTLYEIYMKRLYCI